MNIPGESITPGKKNNHVLKHYYYYFYFFFFRLLISIRALLLRQFQVFIISKYVAIAKVLKVWMQFVAQKCRKKFEDT
jgi:hypothetical protein